MKYLIWKLSLVVKNPSVAKDIAAFLHNTKLSWNPLISLHTEATVRFVMLSGVYLLLKKMIQTFLPTRNSHNVLMYLQKNIYCHQFSPGLFWPPLILHIPYSRYYKTHLYKILSLFGATCIRVFTDFLTFKP